MTCPQSTMTMKVGIEKTLKGCLSIDSISDCRTMNRKTLEQQINLEKIHALRRN